MVLLSAALALVCISCLTSWIHFFFSSLFCWNKSSNSILRKCIWEVNFYRSKHFWGFSWSRMDVRVGHKESWAPKNWCFWTVVLEKTLESPLDCKEVQPVHPKGDQSWVFIGRTDAEGETPILWPPDAKNWLIWKDPDVGRDWRWEEKGMTKGEMVGWNHWLTGYEFE